MKYISTIFLITIFCTTTLADIIFTNDSLPSSHNELITKHEKLLTFSRQLRDSSYGASVQSGKEALAIAKLINNPKLLAQTYKSIGVTYFYQGLFDSSQYYYEKSLEKFKMIGDSLSIGKIIGNIGIIYRRTNKYDKALQQYLEALTIYESLHYEKGIAGAYLNIGGVYQTIEKKEKALQFYLKAKRIFKRLKDDNRLSRVLTNIGVIKLEQGFYKESIKYEKEALELNKNSGMLQLKGIILLNIGQGYSFSNEPQKAIEYYNQCEEIRLKLNDYWGLGKLYLLQSESNKHLKQYTISEEYLKKALQVCKKNKLSEDLKEVYFQYSQLLEEINQPKRALEYLKKYNYTKDSLTENYNNKLFSELREKFESDQRIKEFQLLQQRTQIQKLQLGQKNSWIIILTVVMILGIVAVFVSLRINRLRADHKIMNLRQKVLLTQMNPHFLFNSLTAIQSFILDERNDEANTYLSRLASLVRGILENTREEFITLRTELICLEDYIKLQKLRFENDINYRFEIDASLKQDDVMVPPMLAQPFVENALIHGKLRSNPDAQIIIKVGVTNNRQVLTFSISDNGIGLNESKKNSTSSQRKSLATSIALDRVKIYNFKSSQKMNFEIIDRKDLDPSKSGTRVTYSIPLSVRSYS